MQTHIKTFFRGIGQVMLQSNAPTGLLFLVGIFYNSWLMALGAIIGNLVATATAFALKYPKEEIEDGLYGFNGTLVGIAVWFYFSPNAVTLITIIIGAALSTIIMNVIKKRIPAFTAPFIISTWMVFL